MFRTPAEAYDRYVGRYSGELARALIAAAGVDPDWTVLDVGCGPGALTAELADDGGRRQRRRGGAVGDVRGRLPGAGAGRAGRDRPGRGAAVRRRGLRRRARPARGQLHGRPARRRGGDAPRDPPRRHGGRRGLGLRGGDDAGADVLGRRARARPVGGAGRRAPHGRTARPTASRGLWTAAGLTGVEVEPVTVEAGYDDFADLWGPLEQGVGPAGAYTVALAPDARAALRDELRRRLGAGDAPFRLTARAWIVDRVGPMEVQRASAGDPRVRGRVLGEPVGELGDEAVEPAAQQRAGARELRVEGRDPADRRAVAGRREVDVRRGSS